MIKRYLAGIALLTVITMSGCSAKVQETTAAPHRLPAHRPPRLLRTQEPLPM